MATFNRHPRLIIAGMIAVLGTLAQGTVLAGTASAQATRGAAKPYCGITWGSLEKSGGSLNSAPLITTRTGRHACYDRVVFEFDGHADGYQVQYVNAPETGLAPAGGAILRVKLLNPAVDSWGYPTYPHLFGDHVADLRGYRTLRDVVWGGSYEAGFSIFEIGVRARLPFRVFSLPGPDTRSRIVLDVAHRWS